MGQTIDNYNTGLIFILIFKVILLVLLIIILINKLFKEKTLINIIKKIKNDNKILENDKELYQEELSEINKRVEELIKSRDTLKNIAYSDNLTALPNYNAFIDMIDNIMLTIRQEEVIAIMGIDIDNFKQINETLGRSYGDELLLDVSHRIKQALDENDYFARIGGDKFAILTQNTVNTQIYEEKIKKIQKIFSYPFNLSTVEFFINISIGIAFAPKDGKTSKVLIRNMYDAIQISKINGKNTYSYYDKNFDDLKTEKIKIQAEIRKAIQEKEFSLLYQPIIDLGSNLITGFEALVRWNHPEKGLLKPEDFLLDADENGLIIPISNWITKKACLQLKRWHDKAYSNLTMAINVSSRQFKDSTFVQSAIKIIEEVGVDPTKLEFEITEKIAMEDLDKTLSNINELKEIGVSFSLDDFGTGYSSVTYLKSLPIKNLKIDIDLIDKMLEDTKNKLVVGAIITLGKYMGFTIIAEGVENEEQEVFLKSIKCNKAQGYLYSEGVKEDITYKLLQEYQ